MGEAESVRPLTGCFVLDFSTLLPGPLATLLLAEAGADVLKIERPGGDELCRWPPLWGHEGASFALLNRGKRRLQLDLKDPAQRASVQPLLERADVLVEQFRPGVMQRLGLDYESVAAANPRIIYCSITGYGQYGPKSDVAGHDLNYQAAAGLLSLSMGSLDAPVVPPALIADIAGGSYPAVINILLALRERDQTGRGRHLDVSMSDNLFTFAYWALGSGFAAGEWPGNGTGLVTGGSPRYRLYPTSDGRMLAVAALEQRFWETFCELVGLEGQLRDDSIDPRATAAAVASIVGADSADAWMDRLAHHDCCCCVVATVEEATRDPHFIARRLFSRMLTRADGQSMPALPVPVDEGFRAAGSRQRAADSE